jgi:hypothetical protein
MPHRRRRLAWLAVTAVLFAAWMGYLAYLVLHRPGVGPPTWLDRVARRPAAVPHAPFLVADLNVIAFIPDLNGREVTVKDVPWAKDPQEAKGLVGKKVRVTNLGKCRADSREPDDYLLPLLRTGADTFEVADATGLTEEAKQKFLAQHGVPPSLSPGYEPGAEQDGGPLRPPHIYRATPETLAALRQIH